MLHCHILHVGSFVLGSFWCDFFLPPGQTFPGVVIHDPDGLLGRSAWSQELRLLSVAK